MSHARSDRRVSRTRAKLLASFDRLLLARGYDGVSVCELTAEANVGRSTLYEHFQGKDELLEHSVGRMLAVLAAATTTSAPSDELLDMLTHVSEQRALVIALLEGAARIILISVLSGKLEPYLAAIAKRSAGAPSAPLPFLAASLAHAQIGTVDAWLCEGGCCDARTAARVLHTATRAGVAAMLTGT